MKKILYFGNFKGDIGPVMVNRALKEELKNQNVYFMNREGIVKKITDWFRYFPKCNTIHNSGINGIFAFFSAVLGKLLKKKITYTCHGLVVLEDALNNKVSKKARFIEKTLMNISDTVVLVSYTLKEEAVKFYPVCKDKAQVIYNGYNYDKDLFETSAEKEKNTIVSLGGGRREKGNLQVCKALTKLKDINFKYIVIGEDGIDTGEIMKYPFVNYIGRIPNENVKEYLNKAQLFIQFSHFETFGITPLEALNAKCDIIISNRMGVVEILGSISEDIVCEFDNLEKLSCMVKDKLLKPKTYENFSFYTWNEVSEKYLEIFNE